MVRLLKRQAYGAVIQPWQPSKNKQRISIESLKADKEIAAFYKIHDTEQEVAKTNSKDIAIHFIAIDKRF